MKRLSVISNIEYKYTRVSPLTQIHCSHRERGVAIPLGSFDSLRSLRMTSVNEEELALLRALYRFPEVVERAGDECAPHHVCGYLFDLAQAFNAYYAEHRIADHPYRVALTRALSKTGNPELRSLTKILDASGVRLRFVAQGPARRAGRAARTVSRRAA